MTRHGWWTRLAASVVALLLQVTLLLPAFARPCGAATTSMPGMRMPMEAPYTATGDPLTPHCAHRMPANHRPCTCPSTPAACPCGPGVTPAVLPSVGTVDAPGLLTRLIWHAVVLAPVSLTVAPATPPPKA